MCCQGFRVLSGPVMSCQDLMLKQSDNNQNCFNIVSKTSILSPNFFHLLKLSLAILICFNIFPILLKQIFSRRKCFKFDLQNCLNISLNPLHVEANLFVIRFLQHPSAQAGIIPRNNHKQLVIISIRHREPLYAKDFRRGLIQFVKSLAI